MPALILRGFLTRRSSAGAPGLADAINESSRLALIFWTPTLSSAAFGLATKLGLLLPLPPFYQYTVGGHLRIFILHHLLLPSSSTD